MTAKEKISRARTQLVIFQPFFASLVLRLETEPRPDEWFASKGLNPDIATDGKAIYYSEAFIDQQTLRQVEGLLAHEVGHCFLHHSTRRDWRDKDIWNQAADAVLNPILKEAQFELPEGAINIPDAADKSTEQLYAILEKQAQKQPKGGGGKGPGGGKGGQPPPGKGQQPGSVFDSNDSAAERSHQEQEWNVAVQQAAQAAKQAGNLPGSLERFIEQMKEPKIDWVTVLRMFFEESVPKDYRWFPPASRYVANGDFLPSILKEGYGELVLAIDTSGSISQDQLAQFMGEINHIIGEIKPSTTHVLYCDTEVGRHETFTEGEEVVLQAVGGGGTAFSPVFKYCKKHGITPKALIYMTDLQCSDYGEEPEFPTMWVTEDPSLTAPWGEVLRMLPD
jgi:predicted metal-dependent peptidase